MSSLQIDSQTGVAQRHYNSERLKRERMPGVRQGQIYSYPQKHWRKKKYQYLKYFLQPKRFDPEAEMHTISQVENPSVNPAANTANIPPNEDSNTSGGHPDAKGNILIIYIPSLSFRSRFFFLMINFLQVTLFLFDRLSIGLKGPAWQRTCTRPKICIFSGKKIPRQIKVHKF